MIFLILESHIYYEFLTYQESEDNLVQMELRLCEAKRRAVESRFRLLLLKEVHQFDLLFDGFCGRVEYYISSIHVQSWNCPYKDSIDQ